MQVPVYICLLHTPVVNRRGQTVTTAVTNMDIHDIARSARTYCCQGYFLVTPIEDQHELVGRILGHWRSDSSREYHPDRVEAVSLIQLARSFDEVKAALLAKHGSKPQVVLTDARPFPNSVSYARFREELASPDRNPHQPLVLVFGTGWGVSDVFYPEVDRILAPIYGPEGKPQGRGNGELRETGYNHLSVRSAVAIILDRLFGQ